MDQINNDGLQARIEALSKHSVIPIGPLLRLVSEMLDDAKRQYDHTSAIVLQKVREQLVARMEEGVATDGWVSVSRAAKIVRRPEGTVRYWCREKLVTARKLGARDWEIDVQSLYKRDAA